MSRESHEIPFKEGIVQSCMGDWKTNKKKATENE